MVSPAALDWLTKPFQVIQVEQLAGKDLSSQHDGFSMFYIYVCKYTSAQYMHLYLYIFQYFRYAFSLSLYIYISKFACIQYMHLYLYIFRYFRSTLYIYINVTLFMVILFATASDSDSAPTAGHRARRPASHLLALCSPPKQCH